jgi:glucokinase
MSSMRSVIGIDVGKTKIAAGWVRDNGSVDAWTEIASPAALTVSEVIRAIVDVATRCIRVSPDVPSAIGIGAPGVIDPDTGTVFYGGSIAGWEGTNLADAVASSLELPTFACNDADAAGLAEHTWGAARGAARSAYITIGTGLGYALTEDAHSPRIVRPVSPEVAHAKFFPRRESGTGSVSGRGLVATVQQLTGETLRPPEIFARAQSDERIADACSSFVEAGGWLCAAVDALAKPDVIVLGGGVIMHQPWLSDAIRGHHAEILGHATLAAPVHVAHLGDRAGVAGAGAFALSSKC